MPNRIEAIEGFVVSKGHQQITSLSSAQTLTVPDGVLFCLLSPSTQGIRLRADGTAPTGSVGFPIAAGAVLKYTADPKLLKIIEQTASASLDVWYFGAN